MLFKYVRLWVLENPKNIPWDGKLKIDYKKNYGMDRKNFKWGSDPFYIAYFESKSGTLKDGPRVENIGEIDCYVYKNLDEVKKDHVEIHKDWGMKELKNTYMVQVLCPFDRIAVELAVRHYLVKIHKYRKFYDGFPFTNMRPLLWKGKRVN